jgi:hypothetical protein
VFSTLHIARRRRRRRIKKTKPNQMAALLSSMRAMRHLPNKSRARVAAWRISHVWSVTLSKPWLYPRLFLRTTDISYLIISSKCPLDPLHQTHGTDMLRFRHSSIAGIKVKSDFHLSRALSDRRYVSRAAGASLPSTGNFKKRCFGRSLLPHQFTLAIVTIIMRCLRE